MIEAGPQRHLPVFLLTATGDRDEEGWHTSRAPPDRAGKFDAGKSRHLHIQQGRIRCDSLIRLERLIAVVCDMHLMSIQAQQLGEGIRHVPVVVGDENRGGVALQRRRGRSPRRLRCILDGHAARR